MSTDATQYAWVPPEYNASREPTPSWKDNLVHDPSFPDNFARSARWCPDGSLALAQCENRTLQYLDLMYAFHSQRRLDFHTVVSPASGAPLPSNRTIAQAAPILDFIWYPRATPHDPASFCFVTSVRDTPVRLMDASDGRLRASYKIVDHRERQIGPHSLAFNPSAEKLYCGFEDAIEVFDLNYPGEGTRLATTPSRKSRDGLKGIISALAFCPSYDPSYSFFAAGSLSPPQSGSANVALFSEDTGEKPVGWVGDIKASVTQLAFNPIKPHLLYGSFRRHNALYSWDLRGDTTVPLQIFRPGAESRIETNQKIKFDIDIGGKWLSVGDERGDISMFALDETSASESLTANGVGCDIEPSLRYHAHDDTVGSVAFHPLQPLLLSVSGSRHFDLNEERPTQPGDLEELGSSTSESDESDEEKEEKFVKRQRRRRQPATRDSSYRLWRFDNLV
ncbi:WD40 repeat-like protein [Artomyces pyxidatus]|uniref:WD40 repeat-like protein n=1 Tax=Artomyces pyxidatus TaxID=48021 RepID=A0ACB8TGS0_9AGAM|nr:WD40 repeat-like protein [Artomyces pyxidatus]